MLSTKFYFQSPLEVVKVTPQNIKEAAEWCGGTVEQIESTRFPGRMDSAISVPTPKGSKISLAYPGMYITKRVVRTVKDELRMTYSVFRRDYFDVNYFESPGEAVEKTWARNGDALVKARTGEENVGGEILVPLKPHQKPKKPEFKVDPRVFAKKGMEPIEDADLPEWDSPVTPVVVPPLPEEGLFPEVFDVDGINVFVEKKPELKVVSEDGEDYIVGTALKDMPLEEREDLLREGKITLNQLRASLDMPLIEEVKVSSESL